jgi:hypothetical protein
MPTLIRGYVAYRSPELQQLYATVSQIEDPDPNGPAEAAMEKLITDQYNDIQGRLSNVDKKYRTWAIRFAMEKVDTPSGGTFVRPVIAIGYIHKHNEEQPVVPPQLGRYFNEERVQEMLLQDEDD